MARCCMSKTGEFSAAHLISMGRIEKRPQRPVLRMRLPKEGDTIIYNVRSGFGDRRTSIKKEKRGCIKVTKIYPSILTGISYQIVPGSGERLSMKITLPISDFRSGNILYIKTREQVYSNEFQYDDWKLKDADNLEDMVSRLNPYLKELILSI